MPYYFPFLFEIIGYLYVLTRIIHQIFVMSDQGTINQVFTEYFTCSNSQLLRGPKYE